jgi:AraC family transcriptional regulator
VPSTNRSSSESPIKATSASIAPPRRAITVSQRDVCGFDIKEIFYPPSTSLAMHTHRVAHLSFLVRGRYKEQTGRTEGEFRPGTTILHPAGYTHANQFASFGARVLSVEITPAAVERLSIHHIDLSKRVEQTGGKTARLGYLLAQDLRSSSTATSLHLEGLVFEALAALLELGASRGDSASLWMKPVVEFLHANFRRPVSLGEIAWVAGVHPVHLTRSFRRVHGCTTGDYVRDLRIKYVLAGLAKTDLPITRVALDAGFSDLSHFCQVFRRKLGVSPSAFRKSHRR